MKPRTIVGLVLTCLFIIWAIAERILGAKPDDQVIFAIIFSVYTIAVARDA